MARRHSQDVDPMPLGVADELDEALSFVLGRPKQRDF